MDDLKHKVASAVVSASMTINLLPAVALAAEPDVAIDQTPIVDTVPTDSFMTTSDETNPLPDDLPTDEDNEGENVQPDTESGNLDTEASLDSENRENERPDQSVTSDIASSNDPLGDSETSQIENQIENIDLLETPTGQLTTSASIALDVELVTADACNTAIDPSSAIAVQLETPTSASISEGESAVFSFTASTSGAYELLATSNNPMYRFIYNSTNLNSWVVGSASEELESTYTTWVDAGQTIYIQTCFSDENTTGSITFEVTSTDGNDFENGAYSLVIHNNGYVFSDHCEAPSYTVSSRLQGTHELDPSTDYQIVGWEDSDGNALEGSPTEAGYYRMIVEGCGTYHGRLTSFVTLLDGNDIGLSNLWGVSRSLSITLFNGVLSDPYFTINRIDGIGGPQLIAGKDFTVSWIDSDGTLLEGDPTVGGVYTARLTGQDAYHGTQDIEQISITDTSDISSSMYDMRVFRSNGFILGNDVVTTPSISITGLTIGTDYTVTWYDAEGNELEGAPQELGTFTALIQGIGSYHGSRTATVDLLDGYDLASGFCFFYAGDGKVVPGGIVTEPTIHVSIYDASLTQEPPIEGVDYSVSWETADGTPLDHTPNEAGSYTLTITGLSPYYGTTTIPNVNVVDYCDVSKIIAPYMFLRPSVANGVLSMGELVEKSSGSLDGFTENDYTTTWFLEDGTELPGDPTEAGIYSLRIDGVGTYHGSITFTVSVYDALDINSYTWCVETEDGLTDMVGSMMLLKDGVPITRITDAWNQVPDDCYTITWFDINNVELSGYPEQPGSYRCRIDGINGYYGSYTFTEPVHDYYDISIYDLFVSAYTDNGILHVSSADAALWTYGSGGVHYIYRPSGSIAVTAWTDSNGNPLSGNVEPGVYRATVEGQGKFYGTTNINVTVVASNDIKSFSYEIITPGYINSDGSFTEPVIELHRNQDGTQTTLDPSCYTITEWSGVRPGEAPTIARSYYIVLEGQNGYTGSLSFEVPVVENTSESEETPNPDESNPAIPETPVTPETPEAPETPVTPETPETPEAPGMSEAPDNSTATDSDSTETDSGSIVNPTQPGNNVGVAAGQQTGPQQPASLARTADDTAWPVTALYTGIAAVLAGALSLIGRALNRKNEH